MEITITTTKFFTVADFPPVALLREKVSTGFVNSITEYLDGEDGTNDNPMLVESFINLYRYQVERSGTFDFDILVSKAWEGYTKPGIHFFLQQHLFAEEFLTHCLRFSRDINKIIDWALVLSAVNPHQYFILEDAYYVTSFMNNLSVTAYKQFITLSDNARVPFEQIQSYIELSRALRSNDTNNLYSDKDMFTVAPLYTSEEILTFTNAGHSLPHIILFHKLGLTTAEEVLENGHTIPREWLEVVKTQYV